MTKNKKKLRRAERRYSVTKSAQTLVLAGMLLAGGVSGAMATDLDLGASGSSISNPNLGTEGAKLTESSTDKTVELTGAATGTPTTLTITADDSNAVKLTISATDVHFTGDTTITGASGASGAAKDAELIIKNNVTLDGNITLAGANGKGKANLTIQGDKTLTAGGNITVDYGTLTLGEATGNTTGILTLATGKTLTISDTTNAANSVLEVKSGSATGTNQINGNVIIDKGTLTFTSGNLEIAGSLELKANSTAFTGAGSGKSLTVETLKLGTNLTHTDGTLNLASLETTANKLIMNNGATINFIDGEGAYTTATLSKATTGLLLGNGGALNVGTLDVTAFGATDAIKGTANTTTITADKLLMNNAITFGATDGGNNTLNIRGAADGKTIADFLSHDLTVVGASGKLGTLQLGTTGMTGTATTGKNITLLGDAAAGEASLKVDFGSFEVGTVNVGGTSATDASDKSGQIVVDNGGTLTANIINLFGETDNSHAVLELKGTAANKNSLVNVTTLNVGSTTNYGKVVIAGNATNGTSTLKVDTLNLGTKGRVDIASDGALDIDGNFEIASNKLTYQSTADETLALTNASAKLDVNGLLTLTNAGAVTLDTLGKISADAIKAGDGTKALTLGTTNSGSQHLTLRGDGAGNFIQAASVDITNGNALKLASVDANSSNTYAKGITVTNGSLNVAKGEWTLSDTVDGLIVKTATGVTVNGGTLNVAKWDSKTTSAGTATVQNGKLNLTGTTSGSIKTDSATDIAVSNAGAVTANYDAVFTNDKTLIANTVSQFTVTDTGVLTIKDRADKNITLAAYKDLKSAVMTSGSTGTLRLDGVQITDVPDNAKLADLDGASVSDFVANLDSTNSIAGYGTEVKGLKAAGTAGATDLAVTINNGGLTLVGAEKGFNLSANGDKKTNFTLTGTNSLLMLGSTAGEKKYGTLAGDINLNDATAKFTATNGDFTVGDIVGSATGTIITNNSNLTAGAIGTSTVAQDVELKSSGSLTATKASFANKVTLVGESFSTTAGNDLTVKGAVDITNGTLSSGKDLDLSTSATIAALNGADLKAVNAIKAGALALTAGENGLGISAKTFTSTGALTSTGDNGPLLVNITETLTAASITADSTNTKNSQISAGNMVISGAVALDNNTVLVSTDAAKANTIGGALTLGTTPDADADIAGSAAHMKVDGSLKVTQNTTLLNGSTLEVGEFISSGSKTVTVGDADDSKGSSLIIGKLTAGATANIFFVDPGTDTSFMQIKSMTDGKLNDIAIGSNNSIVSFGEHNEAWSKAQIAESGFKPTATLVMATPIEMGANGQILMGDQYEADGKWDIANNPSASADTYGLALRGDTLVIADMSKADGVTPGIKLHTGHSNVLIENSVGVRLYADKLQANQKALLVSGIGQLEQVAGTAINSGTLDVKHANTTNMLIGIGDIIYDKGTTANSGNLSASTYAKKASSMLPNISSSMGSYLEHMAVTPGFDTTSDNMGIKFVSRALDNRFIGTNNAEQAAATIEGAAQLAVVGAAPAMTLSAVQAGTSTVTTRTSFASPLMDSSKAVALHKDVDGTLSVDSGLSAGNGMKNGFGLWIMPLYQSNSAWGMKADGFKGGYKSDLGGVALGADYTFNDMFRLGLAFNIGGGYAESNGDFNKTENSFNFWGINAYGGWTMNNFGITADVGYTGNYNKLEQELPGAMGMGDIKSDVNSSAWTAGLRGEYKFATEALDIIPHVGVRYTGLTTDEYKAKSGGETVFKVDQDFQSIWTFPIGVTLAKEIETGSGWIIRPQVDLGITPATGDVKAKSKVRIPGVDGQAEMKMQVVDYMSYDGGVGLEMKKDNVSFGINYNIQASEHRTGHGVFGTFRYEF